MPVVEQLVRHGDVMVIYCRGRIILGETSDLHDASLAAIQDTGRLVIHLSEVPYIDSTGLGLLAFLCISARKASGDVKLVAPSAQVADVLDTTMLGTVFEVYPTEEAALAAFAAPPHASTKREMRRRQPPS